MNTLDARGYSCPEPVLMTKKALQDTGAPLEVLVDNQTARNNIERFAKNNGYVIESKAIGNDFSLSIHK